MKFMKMICAVAGAALLLAALVGVASAGHLSTSERNLRASFTRLSFAGGFGTVECEVTDEGSFHERSIEKVVGRLTGYITSGVISRCARGGVTVLTETLPWHIQYSSFTGTLPSITAIRATIIGASFRIREPTFGVTCLARSTTAEPFTVTFNRETVTGALSSAAVAGTVRCGEFSGGLSGTSTSLTSSGGARITVTLI